MSSKTKYLILWEEISRSENFDKMGGGGGNNLFQLTTTMILVITYKLSIEKVVDGNWPQGDTGESRIKISD